MASDPPESDWREFRKLRQVALDRFCARLLDELQERFGPVPGRDDHETCTELFQWVPAQQRRMARAFDDPRRSTMLPQLAILLSERLLEPEEVERLTPETREHVRSIQVLWS